MANTHEFPQEILFEIFLKLPTKSIGKLRLLSRTWHTLLSTPHFINLHQTLKPNQENLILLTRSGSIHLKTNNHFSTYLSQLGDKWYSVLGSCNGLLLLLLKRRYGKMMFVVNPITRKQVSIPNPPLDLRKSVVHEICGFGYDCSCDEYKVVVLSLQLDKKTYEKCGFVYVYCVKSRVWKMVDYPFGCNVRSKTSMAFVHGAVHWLNTGESRLVDRIRGFDLGSGSFREIALPKDLIPKAVFDRLVVFRGCLAIIDCLYSGSTSVWVMKEYGVGESWVRFRIEDNVMWGRQIMPMCFVGVDEMLCVVDTNCWFVYDLKEGVRKKRVGGQIRDSFTDWIVFEESLVSPE